MYKFEEVLGSESHWCPNPKDGVGIATTHRIQEL